MNKLGKGWPGILLVFIGLSFFYKTIIQGLLPVPSDALVGLYHPWRDKFAAEFPRGVPFKNFLITDPVRQQIPWRKQVVEVWKSGRIPSLNPDSFSGTTLRGNIQAGALYPFNLLFWWFDFPVAWSALIISQPILASLFFFWFVRNLGRGKLGATLGAISFGFSGFMIAWLTWGTMAHSALWLPLSLLAIDKLKTQEIRRLRWWIVLNVSILMSWLAGHVQIAGYATVFIGCYALVRWLEVWKERKQLKMNSINWRVLLFGGAVLLTTGLILSFQLMPFLKFIEVSSRAYKVENYLKEGWFMPWQNLIQFFVPDFFGNPATLNYWGVWNYGEFIGYIGVLPMLFAIVAIMTKEMKLNYWRASLLICFLLMLPTPLTSILYKLQLPVFSALQPTRLMFLIDFILAVIAAYGVDYWYENKSRTKWLSVMGGTVIYLIIWILVLGGRGVFPNIEDWEVTKRNLFLPSLFAMIGGGVLIFKMKYPKLLGRTIIGLILLLTIFDLYRFGKKFTPFTPRDYFFSETLTTTYLKNQPKPVRVMSTDERLLPGNVSGYYGIEMVEGYDPLIYNRYEELLWALAIGRPDVEARSGFNRIIGLSQYDERVGKILGVDYVLTLNDLNHFNLELVLKEGETRVYKAKSPGERFYLTDKYRVARTKQEAMQMLFDSEFRVGVEAVVESSIELPQTEIANSVGEVKLERYEANKIELKVNVSSPKLLVVKNANIPGWKADIDGKEVEILQTNYAFQGVVVPQGNHSVRLIYKLGMI